MKKISGVSFWLIVFAAIICIQAYSAFGQDADIVGTWNNGNVGSIQYQNRATGATKSGRGSIFTYKFLANGTYEYVGYMEVSMYNCTTTLFNNITGKYTVSGSTIDLVPNRDFWKNTNSCGSSGNKQQTKTPTPKSVEFQTKTNEYGQQELCINEGTGETCYRREEK